MTNAKEMMSDKNLVVFYIVKGTADEKGAILWKPGENAKQKILEQTKGRDFQIIKITDLYGREKKQEKEEER